jgi:hypothetical protein
LTPTVEQDWFDQNCALEQDWFDQICVLEKDCFDQKKFVN